MASKRISKSFTVQLILLQMCRLVKCMGTLPDASQEGLVREFNGYATLAVFHYTVPPEVKRATWEFASFQDRQFCPHRRVSVHLRRGSFPVVSPDGSKIPDFFFHRGESYKIDVVSEYQPSDSSVLPVYNPLPGPWVAVAYMHREISTEISWSEWMQRKFDLKKCRYSVGSIALWSRADNVELILPSQTSQTFYTSKRFHYYKFHVPEGADAFKLRVANCTQLVKPAPQGSDDDEVDACIDYLGLRARALPFHLPKGFKDSSHRHHSTDFEDTQRRFGVASGDGEAVFVEERPYQGADYYLMVATKGESSFEVSLSFLDCGDIGLYGRQQSEWYMTEKGLEWSSDFNPQNQPKEPKGGFQLFSVKSPVVTEVDRDADYKTIADHDQRHHVQDRERKISFEFAKSTPSMCPATFAFTRVSGVAEFASNFLLQGRSWYTKWLTALEQGTVVTRFETLNFVDSGGFVNINLMMDRKLWTKHDIGEHEEIYQSIVGCVSPGRPPPANLSECPQEWTMKVSDKDSPKTLQTLRVIPYPDPGKWFMAFQVVCAMRRDDSVQPCPSALKRAMVSVGLHVQPCGYRPTSSLCGDHGVCAKATKGQLRLSACTCFDGHRGITCDDSSQAVSISASLSSTLLLTLSNLAFLPAVIVAVYFGLFGEAIVYLSTLLSSTFYHTCDREALTMKLPLALERTCMSLYINREVLQFCDFYCAILSFWVTVVALTLNLSSHSPKSSRSGAVKNFLDLLGAIVIAILVQYNRTGLAVILVPLCLGAVLTVLALTLRFLRRRRIPRPNKPCMSLTVPAAAMALTGLALTALAAQEDIYPYTHSLWHILMAAALLCLLPQCRPRWRRRRRRSNSVSSNLRGKSNPELENEEEEEAQQHDQQQESPTNSCNFISSSSSEETELEMTSSRETNSKASQ